MHEGLSPMVDDSETPCNSYIDYEGVSNDTKNMVNGKVTQVTLIKVSS